MAPGRSHAERLRRAPDVERLRRTVLVLQALTAVAAVAGGALLVAGPDGRLLGLDPALLAGTPFEDWAWPGALLALLVGGGVGLAAVLASRRSRWWRAAAVVAGAGLVLFEAVEVALVGPHPLQAVFAGVGGAVVALAVRARDAPPRTPRTAPSGPGSSW